MAGNIRMTYGGIKAQVGLPLGYCGDEPQLLDLVNEASLILWNAGDWIHKTARYKFRVGTSCCGNRFITWPSEIETVEMLNVCDQPIPVRNIYAEFIANGVGNMEYLNRTGNGSGNGFFGGGRFTMLGDREEVPTFEDIRGTDKKVKVYNSLPADNGTQVIILGYDQNEQWIRTLQSGTYVDGEYVTLNAASPPITTNFFTVIKGVQFSTTPRNGIVYLTEFNTTDSVERTIASYQYNEEFPVYRRSILTGARFTTCTTVIGVVRLRFVPIIFDTDYLQIGNLSALKDMLLSLQKRDNGSVQDAMSYQQMATQKMDNELKQHQGIAPKKIISFQSRNLWSSGVNLR